MTTSSKKAPSTSSSSSSASLLPSQKKKEEEFDWYKQWYPVSVASTLDPTKPHAVRLLGMRLVLWNDGPTATTTSTTSSTSASINADANGTNNNRSPRRLLNQLLLQRGPKKKQLGQWRVFTDVCPHRLSPLSEGRIESSGDLLCSYHGWTFRGCDGQCSSIPYSPSHKEGRHRASERAKCRDYKVKVLDDLIYVFADQSASVEEAESVAVPWIDELHPPPPTPTPTSTPAASPDHLDGNSNDQRENGRAATKEATKKAKEKATKKEIKWIVKTPAGVRDFPCGWDTMIENLLDPAHFCAAHHNTLGNRYVDPQPYPFQFVQEDDVDGGDGDDGRRGGVVGVDEGRFVVQGGLGKLTFVPPCLVKYEPNYPGMPFDGRMIIATYAVPTHDGWTRPLASVLLDSTYRRGTTLSEWALMVFMSKWTPAWLGHVLSSIVLHQDSGILFGQHRNLIERGYGSHNSNKGDQGEGGESAAVDYNDVAFTPNTVDLGVNAFRRWLKLRGGAGGIPWWNGGGNRKEEELTPQATQDLIYDMWDAHTSSCRYCLDAYRRLQRAKWTAVGVCFAALIGMPLGWKRTAVTVSSAVVAGALHKFNGLFRRYEYHHADND